MTARLTLRRRSDGRVFLVRVSGHERRFEQASPVDERGHPIAWSRDLAAVLAEDRAQYVEVPPSAR